WREFKRITFFEAEPALAHRREVFAAWRVSSRRHHCDMVCSISAVTPSSILWAIVASPRFVPWASNVASNVVKKYGSCGGGASGRRKARVKSHQVSTWL